MKLYQYLWKYVRIITKKDSSYDGRIIEGKVTDLVDNDEDNNYENGVILELTPPLQINESDILEIVIIQDPTAVDNNPT